MIGREKELKILEERYNSGKFEMIPVFGRRRVGKTTLLKEFAKGRNGVYFSATKGSLQNNISKLGSKIIGASSSVSMTIESVFQEIRKRSGSRYLLMIDEYPYIIRKDPGFGEALQEFLDDMEDSKLFLILCGSSVSMMKHETLGYTSPIYGRRTGSLEIHPLDFRDSMKMLEGFGREDALRIYGMAGGIPLYLKMFDPSKSLAENVCVQFLREDSFFRNEHELVMMEEFDSPYTYYTVMEALAGGKTRVSEVASYCGLDNTTAHKHLKSLAASGFVERIVPSDNPDGKSARYRISDPFLEFQFRRILPVVDYADDPESAAESVLRLFETDMGRVFEKICSQHLRSLHHGKIGTWWGSDPVNKRQEEIDLILTDESGEKRTGWFAECKFRNIPADQDVLDTLVRRSFLVRGYDQRRYVIYSKSGFSPDLKSREDVELYDLDSIFESCGL